MCRESLANIIALVSAISTLLIFSTPIHGEEWKVLREKQVHVVFEDSLQNAAQEAAALYPEVREELEETFGWRVNFVPTVLLVKESDVFQRMVGSEFIVAFANSGRNQIVMDYSKMKTHPFSLETTLKHELCHLLLHHHIERENLPRWLDEGICQWASDGIAEIILDQRGSILDEAVLSGRYIPIRALTRRFPEERRFLMLAYEESKSMVEFIIGSYGKDGVLAVLNHLKEGVEADTAIQTGLSISLDDLETRWHQHLNRRTTWLAYLINHLYEILFFLAALAMIYGFIRQLMRKRAYQDKDEEDWG